MTDENITTLLHANLDSLELRAESEKSVCKEILGTNQSAYTEAVFEYCLDREIEKWPTNAIKAISGLDPTNLLIYYEEKLEALSDNSKKSEATLNFLQLLFSYGFLNDSSTFITKFVESPLLEKIAKSQIISTEAKIDYLTSLFFKIKNSSSSFTSNLLLEYTYEIFTQKLQPTASFHKLWLHLYTYDPKIALDKAKRCQNFPKDWLNLPLHPELYGSTDSTDKAKFLGKCHKNSTFDSDKLADKSLQIKDEQLISQFTTNSLKNELEELKLVKKLENELNNCKIEAYKKLIIEINSTLQNQDNKIKIQQEKILQMSQKILNSTVSGNMSEDPEIKNEKKLTDVKSPDNLRQFELKLDAIKESHKLRLEKNETEMNCHKITSEKNYNLIRQQNTTIETYKSEITKSRNMFDEVSDELRNIKNGNASLRKVLREKEERIDSLKLEIRNKSKNSIAKVKCLEEANRSQSAMLQRLQQEIIKLAANQIHEDRSRLQSLEIAQSQPVTIRSNR